MTVATILAVTVTVKLPASGITTVGLNHFLAYVVVYQSGVLFYGR